MIYESIFKRKKTEFILRTIIVWCNRHKSTLFYLRTIYNSSNYIVYAVLRHFFSFSLFFFVLIRPQWYSIWTISLRSILYLITSFMQNLWKLTTRSLLSVISKKIFMNETSIRMTIDSIHWIDVLLIVSCSFSLCYSSFVSSKDLMTKIRIIPDDNDHYLLFFFFALLQLNEWFLYEWMPEK